jgi:serine phosphatase RsbU (regulator of sigma subunit)
MDNQTEPKGKKGKTVTAEAARGEKPPAINHQLKIQKALYEIADAASAVSDMQSFYRKLHEIVGKLMHAKSFYVTLYDSATGMLSSPYFADEAGDQPPLPTRIDATNKSLRAHVLLKKKTLHVSATEIEEGRRRGRFEPMGTPAEDWIGVPLKMDGQVIGSLTVQSYEKGVRYDAQDVRLLEFVAQHIAVALTRARAIEETRQRNVELQIINAVQSALAAELDIHGIYDAVGEKLREIFSVQTLAIYSANLESQTIRWEYDVEKGQKFPPMDLPFNSLYEYVLNLDKTLVLNGDFPQFAAKFEDYKVLGNVIPKSVLVTPVIRKTDSNHVVSICLFDMDTGKIFSDTDIRLVETVANAMSVALENARLFNETQQRNTELAIINSVQEGLASKLDMQAIYELVGEKIRTTFNAQVVNIVTYDRDTQLMYGRYYYEDGQVLPGVTLPSFGFRKHVAESCQPLVINRDMSRWMKEYDNPVIQGLQPKSAVFMPMIVGKEAIGVISLQNNDQEDVFSASDIQLLETLANSMSIALENARLWEQEKRYRKALERELEIGREIQAGFLPERLPFLEGWEIAASLMSAREVAGDFYDAFELPDGMIGLVIADVCDKGVGAALFMTLFRSLIRITASQESYEHTGNISVSLSTAERLQRAISLTNNYIAETHYDSGMFATLFFGILDPRDGRLMYINGGHEPPLIIHLGHVRESLCKTGPAVGALKDCHFDVHAVQLNPGEMLFAFTDGAPEAKDPHGEFFGRERLLDNFRQSDQTADELVKASEAQLRGHINGATQFDDITLLVVRRVH